MIFAVWRRIGTFGDGAVKGQFRRGMTRLNKTATLVGAAALMGSMIITTPGLAAKGDLTSSINYAYEQEDGRSASLETIRHSAALNSAYSFTDAFTLGLRVGFSRKETNNGFFKSDTDIMSYSLIPSFQIIDELSLFAGVTFSELETKLFNRKSQSLNYLGGAVFGTDITDNLIVTLAASYSYSEVDPDKFGQGFGAGPALESVTVTPKIGLVLDPVTLTAGVSYLSRNRTSQSNDDKQVYTGALGMKIKLSDMWGIKVKGRHTLNNIGYDRWGGSISLTHKVNLL